MLPGFYLKVLHSTPRRDRFSLAGTIAPFFISLPMLAAQA
jgi:hypothetical protein